MALKVPRWAEWALVFAVIATPGSILARWLEHRFGWVDLWQGLLFRLPVLILACAVASRLFPLQSQKKPQ